MVILIYGCQNKRSSATRISIGKRRKTTSLENDCGNNLKKALEQHRLIIDVNNFSGTCVYSFQNIVQWIVKVTVEQ